MCMNVALTNLGMYNEGVLAFVWLTLPATTEEIAKAFDQIKVSHDNVHYYSNGRGEVATNDYIGEYEEYFITDYECDFYQVGEYENLDNLNELAEQIDSLEEWEQEIVKALMNEGYSLDDAIECKDDCRVWDDCDDMTDVAYRYVEECGLLHDVPDSLKNYFDYEAYGRDLSFDGHWIATDTGYIEVCY